MDVQVYIEGAQLDQFKDEKIELNLNAKNISDIGKIFADFTQSFTVPASPANNKIFTYWFDATVDGTFNANIRVDAYIEIGTLPYKYGSIQLDNAKFKNGKPQSYSITFYGNAVNLSDLFADTELGALDFSSFNHFYNDSVIDAMCDETIEGGDMYYPLINAINEMSLASTNPNRDLLNSGNSITYREFKPAIRDIKILEAIETFYGITFSRDFFDRAVFYNKFTWLQKDAGYMKAFGNIEVIDITTAGTLATYGGTVNTTTNTVTYSSIGAGPINRIIRVVISPATGFESIPYKIYCFNNGVEVSSVEVPSGGAYSMVYGNQKISPANQIQFKISAAASFTFTSIIKLSHWDHSTSPPTYVSGSATSSPQSITSVLIVSEQMPKMKIKDWLISHIAEFNLVITPVSATDFHVDTLDSWYDKGVAYDITKYVDTKEMTVKRPDVKKKIDFLYQKAGAILGLQYMDANAIGYGDLKATFQTAGSDLKIESQYENMLFERLQNETTGDITDIQAGYSIAKDLSPYTGKPFSFYRNGYTDIEDDLNIQPSITLNRIWHTATEDNVLQDQVTNTLNFGSDVSSYFYSEIERGLYFNWWKTFIEDLYDPKTRLYEIPCRLPKSILYRLKMNDRFIISDNKFKISTAKIDLTTGVGAIQIFTDLSAPADSAANVIPLTVDRTDITVDSELYTVDMVSEHLPVTSYVTNGVSFESYIATASREHFEVKITANTNWTVSYTDGGDGVDWFTSNKTTGNRTDYLRISVDPNTGSTRTGIINFTIGSDSFDLTITQNP